jgi:hypothetical protein
MANFTRSNHVLIIFGLLPCFLIACTLTALIPTQESEPKPEMSVATAQRSQEPFSLPVPLYYLQEGQIWRLDSDTQTPMQITQEDAPIDAFDISPANGMLALISENSLITTDPDGLDRQVLRVGGNLPTIADPLARLNNLAYIALAICSPHWSPDGRQIAFFENGLQVYDLETNQTKLIWAQSTTSNEPNLFESVFSWSPDGRYLLVSQYTYPIETLQQRWLSLLQVGGPLYLEIATATQSSFTWSPDMAYLFLANAAYGTESSLMRCDPETMQCRLIAEFEPARWYYHYAFPFVTADERLLVFMGASDDPDQPPEAFRLISLRLDGYERISLREDGYILDSALWSPDGDGVLITLAQASGAHPAGSLLWLSTDDVPAVPLPAVNANNLRWGVIH